MARFTPEQEALIEEGGQTQAALSVAEQRLAGLRSLRVEQMKKMHAAGVSWAQIGRTFDMTPQAAMYATGHAKRQSKKKPTKTEGVDTA